MAGWHHGLDGRESEWTPGVGDGQGGLACCNLWGRKELDTTEWLNWTEDTMLPGRYQSLILIFPTLVYIGGHRTNYKIILFNKNKL